MDNFKRSDCLIFKLKLSEFNSSNIILPDGSYFELWKPQWKLPIRCIGFPWKYNIFWIFHFLKIFSNKYYKAITLKTSQRMDAGLMIVPKYFRWPFMINLDVQIIYVITHPSQRRKGLAKLTITHTLELLKSITNVKTVWYVTTADNIASQKLCTSLGFEFAGYGIRKVKYGFFKTLELEVD